MPYVPLKRSNTGCNGILSISGSSFKQPQEATMDEDVLNIQIRKFLKNVGITSQREIELAVRAAINSGKLTGNETLKTTVKLSITEIGLDKQIDGEIALE
jgi:hypothetical protein